MSNALLNAFIILIENNSELIEDDRDLHFQVTQWSDNDLEELADRVAEYCQTRPQLYAALKSLLGQTEIRLPGKGTTVPPLQASDYKHTILNTMHRVFETPTPSKKSQS